MNKKLIEKIQKLLALATSPVEAEAKAAAEKANELLLRHNLSMQEVASEEKLYDGPVVVNKNKLGTEDSYIFGILGDHFFIRVIHDYRYRKHGGGTRVHFVGEETNLQVAIYVYGFLSGAYKRLWKAFAEKHGLSRRHKKSYYVGLTDGIKSQLTIKRQSVETETGLIVVPDANLDLFVENSLGKTSKIGGGKYFHYPEIEEAGFKDGKNLHIRRGIEQQGTEKDLYLDYK